MSGEEKKAFKTIRNQFIGIFLSTCLAGLGMNFMFMTTINQIVKSVKEDQRVATDRLRNLELTVARMK